MIRQTMRFLGVAGLAALVLQSGATAQRTARRGAQRAPRMVSVAMVPVAALDSVLHLTADQKSKIEAIDKQFAADTKSLRPTPGTPQTKENRDKIAALSQKATQDVEAVLTPDQKAMLTETLQKFTVMAFVGIPLQAVGKLNLTADQKVKIEGIAKDARAKMETLTPADRRVQGREIRKAAHEQVLALLTDAQKQILAKARTGRPGGRGAGATKTGV